MKHSKINSSQCVFSTKKLTKIFTTLNKYTKSIFFLKLKKNVNFEMYRALKTVEKLEWYFTFLTLSINAWANIKIIDVQRDISVWREIDSLFHLIIENMQIESIGVTHCLRSPSNKIALLFLELLKSESKLNFINDVTIWD